MRVHITLDPDCSPQEFDPQEVRSQLEEAGVREISTRHLARFGLVSGQLDRGQFAAVEALPIVYAVEADGVVKAI
ncbi:hypothetical protein [uncultured Deinococcus sp.]|uniref:hypothetical protein n=1 Tax=uncultured Deinococcus sp. TaxID=158789 RepID=UPI00258FFF50|nr:hypothetical protein [uncultured Deinococcus sp.]